MIFQIILLIGLLICYGYKIGMVREKILLPIALLIYVFTIFPSFNIPFIIDDLDHLATLSTAIDHNTLDAWILEPHNEHVMPIIKWLYAFSYKNFWFDPLFLHLVIAIVSVGILYLMYQLVKAITGSTFIGFIGLSILLGSNLPDYSTFVICDSHILFCVFFLLLLLYAQYQFYLSEKSIWLSVIFVSTLFAPMTFGLGHISLFIAYLFERFFLKTGTTAKKISSVPTVLLGWILGLTFYVMNLHKIIFTPHYKDIGAISAFDKVSILNSFKLLFIYIYHDLIPNITTNIYITMGLFYLCIWVLWKFKGEISKSKLWSLLFFGFVPTIVIYLFRSPWGTAALQYSRYDIFPLIAMTLIYSLAIGVFIKQKCSLSSEKILITYLLCFVLIAQAGSNRYIKSENISKETSQIIQLFYVNYTTAFQQFFLDHPEVKNLNVKRNNLYFPSSPSLTTKNGGSPLLTRYLRSTDFFASFLLPANVRNRITWNDSATDKIFTDYLKQPVFQNKYKDFVMAVE